MTTSAQLKQKKFSFKRLLGFLLKLAILFALFFALLIFILNQIEDQKEPLKQGIERYLRDSTGYPIKIGEISSLSLYPDIAVKLENLYLKPSEESEKLDLEGEYFQVSIPFWSLLLRKKQIEQFDIQNLKIAENIFAPHSINIQSLSLRHTEDKEDYLEAKGSYNNHDFNFTLSLQSQVYQDNRRIFTFPKQQKLDATIGDLKVNAIIKGEKGHIKFGDVTVSLKGNEFEGGGYIKPDSSLSFGGVIQADQSEIQAVLKHSEQLISGNIKSPSLDVQAIEKIAGLFGYLDSIFSFEESSDDTGAALDISIKIESLTNDSTIIGQLSFPVKGDKKELVAGPIEGDILNGKLVGTIQSDNKNIQTDLSFQNIDYSSLQTSFSGKASGRVDLNSHADAFIENLTGKVSFVTGQGKFQNEALITLAGGLINAVFPDFDTQSASEMNCGIADFTVEKGVMTAQTVFADFKNTTFAGTGTIDLVRQNYDLTIKPEAKDPAIFDVATDIKIGGSFSDPKIGPEAFSVVQKIGGLVLGTINPALLVFSLTDLGLSDSHPCAAYVGQNEEVPQ